MAITSAIVLFAVIWFLVMFCVLTLRLETQGDRGAILRGTHAGSPENPRMWRRVWITTGITGVIWALSVALILSGWLSIRDFDLFTRWGLAGEPWAEPAD